MRRFFRSFASKLSFYILLLTTAIFVSIAAIFGHYQEQRAYRHAVLYTSAFLTTILDDVELELNDVEHLVNMMKTQVEYNINDPKAMSRLLTDMVSRDNLIMGGAVALEPGYYNDERQLFMEYAYVNPKGEISIKNLDGQEYDYQHMAWYTTPRDTKSDSWSDPYQDDGGGDRLMTTYSTPLIDNSGHVYGVFTADVAIEELVNYVETMRPYPDGYTFIVNDKGSYMAHPDSTVVLTKDIMSRARDIDSPQLAEIGREMIAQKEGAAQYFVDGTQVLACYAPIPNLNWSVCYVCSYDAILKSLGNIMIYIYLILLAGLVILTVLIHRVIRRQTKPMEQLTAASYQMSGGDFDAPLPKIDTHDELQKLHDGFAFMQSSLKDYISRLTEATIAKERIASELKIAHDIQMSLVPRDFSPGAGHSELDIHGALVPAKEVGGDLYDFVIHDDRLYFAIGDVSGKGVPAALIMAVTRSRFRLFCEHETSPVNIVTGLNQALCAENDAFMFVTMFVGVLDLNTRRLTYCNAGHNPVILAPVIGDARFLDVTPNLPLGVDGDFKYEEQVCQLDADTSLVLYTDGVTEAERADHEQYGEQRLLNLLTSQPTRTSKDIIDNIQHDVATFVAGAEPSDDLTLLVIQLNAMNETTTSMNEAMLTMTNSLDEIARLHVFVESLAERYNVPADKIMSIDLAIEEAVANVIQYAYPEGTSGEIILTASCHDDTLKFTIQDRGAAFDPTAQPDPDTTLALEDRPIGGLGIMLIRRLMTTVNYTRLHSTNILSLTLNLR